MSNNFANMSAEELLALVPTNEFDGPDATVVVTSPQPQAQVSEIPAFPPPAPRATEETRGRPRHNDPTNPEHILAIAKRAKFHHYWTGTCYLPGWTKRGAVEYAKQLKEQGNPVNARLDDEDTLVFW